MGAGSTSGVKGPEAGLIELPETTVRKDIEINMPETLINSIDKTLLLSRRVGSLYERELREGSRTKVEELQEKVDKNNEEKEAWKKEKEEWEAERKRLATWGEKDDGLEVELEDLKSCIIQEHINGFQKGVRKASFFYENVDGNDARFDVNKDVVNDVLIDEAESSPDGVGVKDAVDADVGDILGPFSPDKGQMLSLIHI
ncbi:hypothetical protein DEO72_LG8g1520 [Vigna unguiculata]|uniref:Uncharacterized protein n=1 Tax=Vigna unguiculata TaxID=3917 RepID=A0A4D6MUB5_VIGUN|nr:hypothetical protein DEO72_LG8g1520 [Vigna unguiculata]